VEETFQHLDVDKKRGTPQPVLKPKTLPTESQPKERQMFKVRENLVPEGGDPYCPSLKIQDKRKNQRGSIGKVPPAKRGEERKKCRKKEEENLSLK